ncbi:MAG: O-antigen ligase, partial [Desulfuromonadaceae bacterium]|nr:O-antigen ligase [Desulfuromonadaceae bacterium]
RPEAFDRADSFEFVDAALNVSTIFASSHSDFGYTGDVILMFLLMAWTFFWFSRLRSSAYYILPYAMVCCVLIFSVFYNLFLLYPYLFATVLQGYIANRCITKSENFGCTLLNPRESKDMSKSDDAVLVSSDVVLEDKNGFSRLVKVIKRNVYLLLGGALLGGFFGLALAFVLPSEWEANSLVRLGQLGRGNVIESPLLAIDRLKSKSFQNDVLRNLKLSTNEDDEKGKAFRSSLKIKLEKSDLINITLRGNSSEEARLHMGALIGQLKAVHTGIYLPGINRWKQELQALNSDLKLASNETQRLFSLLNKQDGVAVDKFFSQTIILNNDLVLRERELQVLSDRKRILEERLSPEQTFETSSLGGVEISERPIFPKKSIFMILGLIVGMLIGLGWSIQREATVFG